MKKLYYFEINPSFSLEEAWSKLESEGIEPAYGSEEEEIKYIYGYSDQMDFLLTSEMILIVRETQFPPINWEDQWSFHGLNFQNGYVNVNLSQFNLPVQEHVRLEPGPGFGDLSHPTTRLVLKMMGKYIQSCPVIDIGCGSGILALAAAASGASQVYGIDIEPEALEHSRANLQLNRMEKICNFSLPKDFDFVPTPTEFILIVMNMITSEQKIAWQSLSNLHDAFGFCITCGIRKEEKEAYLLETKKWKWKLKEECEEEGWLAFVFSMNKNDL